MPVEPGQVPTPEPPVPGAPVTPPAVPQNPVEPDPANPAPETPPANPPSNPAEPKVYDENYVKGLRTENANWRTKFQDAQTKLDDAARAQMTEQQRLEADVKKFQDETVPSLQRENRKLSVQVAAGKMGVVDPEAVTALLDWTKIDGGATIEAAITDLLEQKPYLKASGQPAQPIAPVVPPSETSPANPPGGGSTPPTFTKSQLATMSPTDYEKNMAAIQDAIVNGRVDYSR